MNVDIPISFVNPVQAEAYYSTKRNQCFSGGYGNGKSFEASMKAMTLLCTFPRYRIGISRYSAKELQQSTMETFFKICPPELYNDSYGGRRNDRDGYLRLINGSEVIWMHLDDYAEEDLRGKEFNTVITDQGEEISENIYITLDSRMERWDQTIIPEELNPSRFPKNPYSNKPMPPCYNLLLCNPDTTLHWIYKRCHDESPMVEHYGGPLQSRKSFGEYSYCCEYETSAYFSAATADNPAIPNSLKLEMMKRDKSWVDRFYWGKWGIAGGAIHYIYEQSIVEFKNSKTGEDYSPRVRKLLEIIRKDGIKYRVMDHGEAAPTCCLWFAYLPPSVLYRNYNIKSKGIHICYREYYQPGKIIKYHREQIQALSKDERYYENYADPAIFKKTSEKYGGFWSTAEDYTDTQGFTEEELNKAPPILWSPADNNEMSCRDAIAEMLLLEDNVTNPLTGETPAPSLYFIKKCNEYPSGASFAIAQLQSVRRKKITSVDGQEVYSDERADGNDHAYDPVRYYAIMPKTMELPTEPLEKPEFSIGAFIERARRNHGRIRSY